ncbi:glycoside hydrolase family 5 protein [Roseateles sp.]|uniref:glycoside hydrolase family 5 protein n=1 Tax=Roseateles sp. TaxID=1971397 RepID=UPI002DF8F41D|nr:glycoside hydrolase family 5 protein [Roseateles sp.]
MNTNFSRRDALRVASLALTGGWAGHASAAEGQTALLFAERMTPGINLGNTLEALPNETSWGQPATTQATMDGFKAAGFKSVRIPVAWFAHADAEDRVDPRWMARVRQVVDYALQAGLIVMINTHWDGGWLNHTSYDKQASLNRRLAGLWTQIATAFRDCDERLVFAGTNEVGMENLWTPPTQEYADVQNSFNQTFVTTVRATGGANASRFLVVQGYNTNIGHTLKYAVMPTDSVPDRLMMEVHYYDPYEFTLNGKGRIWQWGAKAKDPKATQTWADEPWVEKEFASLEERFVRRGVPVLIGEYGAYPKKQYPGMRAYVHDWIRVVTSSMRRHGLVPMWWDTGGLIDRRTGRPREAEMLRLIVDNGR